MLNIWIDEAYTLNTTSKGPGYAYKQAIFLENQPPLYFVTLSIWRILNKSIFFARFLSCLFILAFLLIIKKISTYVIPSMSSFWIFLIAAFNPFIIWAATEIRFYALGLLLSAGLLLIFYKLFMLEDKSALSWALYFLIITASLATNYYFIFFYLGLGAALVVNRKYAYLKPFIIAHTLSIIMLLPFLHYSVEHTRMHLPLNRDAQNLLYIFKCLAQDLWFYFFPIKFAPLIISVLIGLIILLFLMMNLIKRPYAITDVHKSLWTIFFTIFTCYLFLGLGTNVSYIRGRYLYLAILVMILSFYSLGNLLNKRIMQHAVLFSSVLILGFYLLALYWNYSPLAKVGDYIRVASYIEKSERPQQPIFIHPSISAKALTYYYSGINPIIHLPYEFSFETYDQHDIITSFAGVIENELQISEILSNDFPEAEGFWFFRLSWDDWLGIDFQLGRLELFLDSHYNRNLRKVFHGSVLSFYKLRGGKYHQQK